MLINQIFLAFNTEDALGQLKEAKFHQAGVSGDVVLGISGSGGAERLKEERVSAERLEFALIIIIMYNFQHGDFSNRL